MSEIKPRALYNENCDYAAAWLRNLIAAGHIAPGIVDTRSICDIPAAYLRQFNQVHLFAGLGGWSYAARLAGWPDDRPLWTASCPCQPYSVAGKGKGTEDARDLWPEAYRLANWCRPDVIVGEQVAAAVGKDWLDRVYVDLESIGYTTRAAVVPACAVDAPHRRDRLWFVADRVGDRDVADDARLDDGRRTPEPAQRHKLEFRIGGVVVHVADRDSLRGQVDTDARGRADGSGSGQIAGPGSARDGHVANEHGAGPQGRVALPECGIERTVGADGVAVEHAARVTERKPHDQGDTVANGGETRDLPSRASHWRDAVLISGADGKARRVKPGIRLLANGIPARVGKLRALGNAIVPPLAAEVIGAYMDCDP